MCLAYGVSKERWAAAKPITALCLPNTTLFNQLRPERGMKQWGRKTDRKHGGRGEDIAALTGMEKMRSGGKNGGISPDGADERGRE